MDTSIPGSLNALGPGSEGIKRIEIEKNIVIWLLLKTVSKEKTDWNLFFKLIFFVVFTVLFFASPWS